MNIDPNAPTDENVAFGRSPEPAASQTSALHLVIAWFVDEYERTGHAARLDAPCWLGRGPSRPEDAGVPLAFVEQRPGEVLATVPIERTVISRRQLLFAPEPGGGVRVTCVGRRALFHNGARIRECHARAGDTLMLEETAVFVLEERPIDPDPLRFYGPPAFAFGQPDPQGLVGESPTAWHLRELLAAAAQSEAHILIQGGSGAGKELAARIVHERSSRRRGPLVARSAATLPPGLLDAELFGTAKNYPNAGAAEREGLVGAAHGGSLLLDEIGEIPEEHQAHLLRVLDRGGEYHRLGEAQARRSDFRLIAATNRPLEHLKHDLAARLSLRIHVPGLDERRSDVPLLACALLDRIAAESPGLRDDLFERGLYPRIHPALMDRLTRHRYTHHTRELERLLRIAIATSPADHLSATPEILRELEPSAPAPTGGAVDERERAANALAACDGNVSRAARQLGVTRHALHRLVKKYGLRTQ